MLPLHFVLALLATVAVCRAALPPSTFTIVYCSSINTSSNQKNTSIFQSDGLCTNFCGSDYAFAITQGQGCWCSNYIPSLTVDTSNCDYPCPGWQSDLCGGNNLYGYVALQKLPAGTTGPTSTGQSSSPVTVTVSGKSVTVTKTFSVSVVASSVVDSSAVVSPGVVSSTVTTSAVTTSATSSTSRSTWTRTPVISIQTVTGQVETITYTPTAPPSTANQATISESGNSSLNTGQAVGLTFGLVSLALLIAGIIFFCVRKRNKQKRKEAEAESAAGTLSRNGSSNLGNIPQRTMSENSRFMLQTDGRQVVEGWETGDSGTPGSRTSRLLPVDPRLDPYAGVYQRGDGSKSRESVKTMQDNHDYSRRVLQSGPILRATNPD